VGFGMILTLLRTKVASNLETISRGRMMMALYIEVKVPIMLQLAGIIRIVLTAIITMITK
jgi:hypothetical protein